MVILLSNYKVVKVCPTAEQAFYHADLLKLPDYYVDDACLSTYEHFTNEELAKILANHNVNLTYLHKWDREVRLGAVSNAVCALDVDNTPIVALQGKLGHVPEAPQIAKLTHTQREKQMGPANTTRTVQSSTASSTAKRPKAGSTTAAVWEECDSLFASGSKIEDNSLRDALLAWAEEQGINKSTARTQYGHWKRDKLCSQAIAQPEQS